VAAAGAAALLLSACATVPDSGPIQAGKVALAVGGQNPGYPQLIPVPPKPGWTAVQVVKGFLAACASFSNNHAVARQYLDPAKRHTWKPGWAVTVVGAPRVGQAIKFAHNVGVPNNQGEKVPVTGEELATLSDTGQYRFTTGSSTYPFRLFRVAGEWRIDNPPSRLLLTESDFKRVYAPRNLYYVASPTQALVPDPVFVPLQATSATLATKLATALLHPPEGCLTGGVSTAFPPGAKLLRATLNDGTATINLGGAAVHATPAQLSYMISQLVWTLAGHSYGPSAVQSVELEINGHPWQSKSLSGSRLALSVPEAPADQPLYSLAATGVLQEQTRSAPVPRPVPGETGDGRVHLASIAVSPPAPDGVRYVAGFTASRDVVYYGPIRRDGRLSTWSVPRGEVTSLSWDVRGNLWVASPKAVWMLPPPGHSGKTRAVQLGLGLSPGSVVSQLRVAPDGVRVAMIAREPGRSGQHLLLAAIGKAPGGAPALGHAVSIGTGLRHPPAQLTWYDADHLIVLSRSQSAGQLWEVPVNGGSSTALFSDSATRSITAAGPANPMAAGLGPGQLALESNLNGLWVPQRGTAGSPAYPG
jgi:Lipoprotein LpqB beta-propeller domain/Sporulation and spore germination